MLKHLDHTICCLQLTITYRGRESSQWGWVLIRKKGKFILLVLLGTPKVTAVVFSAASPVIHCMPGSRKGGWGW